MKTLIAILLTLIASTALAEYEIQDYDSPPWSGTANVNSLGDEVGYTRQTYGVRFYGYVNLAGEWPQSRLCYRFTSGRYAGRCGLGTQLMAINDYRLAVGYAWESNMARSVTYDPLTRTFERLDLSQSPDSLYSHMANHIDNEGNIVGTVSRFGVRQMFVRWCDGQVDYIDTGAEAVGLRMVDGNVCGSLQAGGYVCAIPQDVQPRDCGQSAPEPVPAPQPVPTPEPTPEPEQPTGVCPAGKKPVMEDDGVHCEDDE